MGCRATQGKVLLFFTALSACIAAQSQISPEGNLNAPITERGFISPHHYTNAFFGFSLPLPASGHFQVVDLSQDDKALQHSLFAEKSLDKGVTLLLVSATQVLGSPDDEAQKMVFLPGSQGKTGPGALSIGGRLFWKSQIEQKVFAGKLYRSRYTTGVPGFVLQFSVSSYNGKLADDLRDRIESIEFFDPAKAKEVAGAESHPFLPLAARLRLESAPQLDLAHLEPGAISADAYINSYLGFSYHFPDSWYLTAGPALDGATQSGVRAVSNAPEQHRQQAPAEQCTRVLASATKDPPEKQAQQFNPRVMILAADPACFAPDLKFPASIHDQATLEFF